MRIRHAVVLISLAFSSAALANDPYDPSQPTPTTTEPTATAPDTSAKPGKGPMEQLTDGQILEAALELNEMEKEHARYMIGKTKNKEVEGYAQRLVNDHKLLIDNLRKWGNEADVLPKSSITENRINEKNHEGKNKLQDKKGKQLDREYINQSVAGHEKTLAKVDAWAAMATDPGLRLVLTSARPTLEVDLAEARRLQTSLGGAPATTSGAMDQPTNNIVTPIQ